jgi:hypothetical protein
MFFPRETNVGVEHSGAAATQVQAFAITITYLEWRKRVEFGDSVLRQQAAAIQGASKLSKLAHSKATPSHLFGDDERPAILASEEPVGLRVVREALAAAVEDQRPLEPVGDVSQVAQRG